MLQTSQHVTLVKYYTADIMLVQAVAPITFVPPPSNPARQVTPPPGRGGSDVESEGNAPVSPDIDIYNHIYLSPHLDDVVLSCGGTIWQHVQARRRVLVVTIFAGPPDPGAPISSFAQQLHARWGLPANAAAERQREDLAAASLLGAQVQHWPYTDCIYRQASTGRFLYANMDALWGEIDPAEHALVEELAERLAVLTQGQDAALYVPMGIGHHVDHQIARRAAELSGQPLTYYEDFPYAENPQAVETILEQEHGQAELVLLSEEALETKIAAIACYRSQISTFWKGETAMGASVRAFAQRTGSGRPAERYWRLDTEMHTS